jgi:hypothetical protein
MTPHDQSYLDHLAATLRGPRRSRKRLLEEMSAHLHDLVDAELGRGADPAHAEARAMARLGEADTLAERWNAYQDSRRGSRRRRAAMLALAAVAAGALGITQYAAGRPPAGPHHAPACSRTDGGPAEVPPCLEPR